MNYIDITPFDIANGLGCRVTLWVSGCSHHCMGCQNPETWDENFGRPFTEKTLQDLISYLSPSTIQGLTLSGGDPLYKNNIEKITEICKKVKEIYPEKTIWCYSGYIYEQIKDWEILNYIDVLVDGKFVFENRDVTLAFRGSPNQRIIDIKKTKKENKIIELNL